MIYLIEILAFICGIAYTGIGVALSDKIVRDEGILYSSKKALMVIYEIIVVLLWPIVLLIIFIIPFVFLFLIAMASLASHMFKQKD